MSAATPESCATPSQFVVANELAEPLRLSFLADDAELTVDSSPWLAPRQRHTLKLPADAAGWVVGVRRVWHTLVGTNELTHVVRRAANRSAGFGVVSPLPSPRAPESNASFVLLVSAERTPLELCTAAPAACYGLLSPLGRRYVHGLPPGSFLEALEPVWGERWAPGEPSGGSSSSSSGSSSSPRRVSRALPLSQAGYSHAWSAHAARNVPAPAEAAAKGTRQRLMSHLAQVCDLPISPPSQTFSHLHRLLLACAARPPLPPPLC